MVTLPQHPQANDVIGHAILEKNARGVSAVQYVPPVSPGAATYLAGRAAPVPGRNRYPLTVMGEEIDVDSPLLDGTSCATLRWQLPPRKSWGSSALR